MRSVDETLARLRVLLWVAQADGEIQPWEKTMLERAWQELHPLETETDARLAEPSDLLSLDRLLQTPFSLEQAISLLQTPDVQQDTYQEAVAIAQLDGITPSEENRLAYLRRAFHLPPLALETASSATAKGAAEVDWSAPTVSGRGIVLGMRRLINHSRQVRSLILDYALGAAIIGLIPIPQLLIFKLLGVAVLNFKMLRDVGSHWGFPKGIDKLAMVGNLFGFLGALAIAFMAWLTLFGLGIVLPPLRALAAAAAFSSFTWAVGQVTNQYYMSSSRLDVTALRQVLQRQNQGQTRRGRQWKN